MIRKSLIMVADQGFIVSDWKKRGYDVTGVDFSENSIQYAKESAQDKGLVIVTKII